MTHRTSLSLIAAPILFALFAGCTSRFESRAGGPPPVEAASSPTPAAKGETAHLIFAEIKPEEKTAGLPKPRPLAPSVEKGLEWLVRAQHENGGWGAGSHASQQIRDPHQVETDPATTAFTAMAFLRLGHTPVSGAYQESLRRATEHLLDVVEKAPADGPRITDLQGTQPQAKLGQLVDTAMAVQYFSRLLTALPDETPIKKRVDAALDKCLRKLEKTQNADGSWNYGGGWAPVLQSSLACNSMEIALAAGKQVDRAVLDKARNYQKGNFDLATGKARSDAAAGVELYAFSGSQRAGANQAWAARQMVEAAKREGKLGANETVTAANLEHLGVDKQKAQELELACSQADAQSARLGDESLLSGFGNNGGEEYLSYLFTSESLVLSGGAKWEEWNGKMHERLAKIQSPDGSWTGHHCITSPVFCTSAVVQCLTTDQDAPRMLAIAQAAAKREIKAGK
ncbi:MAG: hypothetical protein HY717_17040 [Planctomycetes bacterium]|nr:hypothetical protein [Planctomycetota bacterium]